MIQKVLMNQEQNHSLQRMRYINGFVIPTHTFNISWRMWNLNRHCHIKRTVWRLCGVHNLQQLMRRIGVVHRVDLVTTVQTYVQCRIFLALTLLIQICLSVMITTARVHTCRVLWLANTLETCLLSKVGQRTSQED